MINKIIVILFSFWSFQSLSNDLSDFNIKYKDKSKLSYGAFTVSEKLPALKELGYKHHKYQFPILSDQYGIRYQLIENLDYGSLPVPGGEYLNTKISLSCKRIIKNSEEKKAYYRKKSEHTNSEEVSELRAIDSKFKKQQFKRLTSIPKEDQLPISDFDENYESAKLLVGVNDEVVQYDFLKSYPIVPEHDELKNIMLNIFGTPSNVIEKNNVMYLTYGKFDGRKSNGIHNYLDKLYKSFDRHKSEGIVTWVTSNRANNNIRFNSIDLGKTYKSFVAYRDRCVNEKKQLYKTLLEKEEAHYKKKRNQFEL